jgi:hypothetical protein
MTANLVVQPDHPRRQTVLPPRHEAASRDRLGSDSAGAGPVHESLGDTRSAMPPSHRWERLNRTALGHLGPGSPKLTVARGGTNGKPALRLRDAGRARVDIGAIKGKLLRSPAPGHRDRAPVGGAFSVLCRRHWRDPRGSPAGRELVLDRARAASRQRSTCSLQAGRTAVRRDARALSIRRHLFSG